MEVLDQPITDKPVKTDRFGRMLRVMEYVAVFFILIGYLFRFQRWPGAGESHLIGFGLLAVVYFPLCLVYGAVSKRFPSTADKVAMALLAVTLGIAAVGIQFRTFFWPFGSQMVFIAAALFVPSLALVLMARLGKMSLCRETARWGLRRLILLGIPLVFFVFTNQMEYYGMVGSFKNNPKYMEAYAECYGRKNETACASLQKFHKAYNEANDAMRQQRMLNGEEWID